MKKKYIKPDFEAIKITTEASMRACSAKEATLDLNDYSYEDEEEYDDVPW